MAGVAHTVSRRALLSSGAAAAAALLAGACGPFSPQAGQKAVQGPKEMTWSCYQLGEARQKLWDETFQAAQKATGIKVNVIWEPGAGYWDKRQAEQAAGSPAVDIMINQLNWVVPGGLNGLFVDHMELMRRDKVDTKQYLKADLDSWSWKTKLYAVPMQSGGEVVFYNKKLFQAKGVKFPHKDWTYDDLLDACRRLNDPTNGRFAIQVGQNGLHYMMGTFVLNFGGKLLNDVRDKALYADDNNSIRGAELDVDLHTKHRFTPTPEALATVPPGRRAFELEMVAIYIEGLFAHTNARASIGAENLDFAPPPKGPTGIQRVSVGGNAWSIMALSKAREAAWAVLKWSHTRDGMLGPQLEGVSWPPVIWAAQSPKWLEIFKGTHITDCSKVWETGGHDLLVLPEGDKAWSTMNTPMNRALRGEISTREALQESARQLNELFAQRPAAWK